MFAKATDPAVIHHALLIHAVLACDEDCYGGTHVFLWFMLQVV